MNELMSISDWHDRDWHDSELASLRDTRLTEAERDIALIERSGLFEPVSYAAQLHDPPRGAHALLRDFMSGGWRAGRRPNPYFDPGWYLARNPDVARSGENPLAHYVRQGEALGRAPAETFDLLWYRGQHQIARGETALGHFLERRLTGGVSPIAEFDPAYYLRANPDVAAAGVDPFDHYLLYGYREARDPSAEFDTRFYMRRYLGAGTDINPLIHYRRFRHVMCLHTRRPATEVSTLDEVHRFTRPGPEFEARAACRASPGTTSRASRAISATIHWRTPTPCGARSPSPRRPGCSASCSISTGSTVAACWSARSTRSSPTARSISRSA